MFCAGISVRPAISTDAGQITELANTAFMEDGVYKDPEKIDTVAVIEFFNRNEVANENKRKRKQRVFDFDELSDLLEVHAFT